MTVNQCQTLTTRSLLLGVLIAAAGSLSPAYADDERSRPGDTSPFLIGHWKLNDVFSDFTAKGFKPLATQNTGFVFINPTNLTLTLEYAFFATDDKTKAVTFCGCDRDTLNPNGRVRYTMQGEVEGGQFSRTNCPTQTDGVMKTIVFTDAPKSPTISFNDATQGGYQIDVFGGNEIEMSTAPLLAVELNEHTRKEAQAVHAACNSFIH